MNDLSALLRILLRVYLIWLAGCLLIWAFLPDTKPFMAGLILGSSISLINAQLLNVKIIQLTRLVLENQARRFSLGFLSRASLVLIAVMAALKLEQFDVLATAIGIFYTPVASFFIGFISNITNSSNR